MTPERIIKRAFWIAFAVCIVGAIVLMLDIWNAANANCRVQCPVVVTPAAIVTAVPVYAPTVAVAAPYGYTYTPQQPVTVNVTISAHDIAKEIVNELNSAPLPSPPPVPSAGQPTPPAPVPTQSAERVSAPPGAIAANCLFCHSQGHNAAAVAKIDLTQPLSCEQRLACVRAVLRGAMPRGKTLNADDAGHVLEELAGK